MTIFGDNVSSRAQPTARDRFANLDAVQKFKVAKQSAYDDRKSSVGALFEESAGSSSICSVTSMPNESLTEAWYSCRDN